MAYRTIMTYLPAPDRVAPVMDVALPLARKHEAHLIGLHVIPEPHIYAAVAAEMSAVVLDAQTNYYHEQAAQVSGRVRAACPRRRPRSRMAVRQLPRASDRRSGQRAQRCGRPDDHQPGKPRERLGDAGRPAGPADRRERPSGVAGPLWRRYRGDRNLCHRRLGRQPGSRPRRIRRGPDPCRRQAGQSAVARPPEHGRRRVVHGLGRHNPRACTPRHRGRGGIRYRRQPVGRRSSSVACLPAGWRPLGDGMFRAYPGSASSSSAARPAMCCRTPRSRC